MPEPEIIQAYDAIAPHYAEYSSGRQAYLDAVDRLVIEQLEPGMRLLDIGSGDGRRLAKIMRAAGLTDIVAVEPSTEMAKLCAAATGATVHRAVGEELDSLAIGKFDAATVLWNVLGHVPDGKRRLRILTRIHDKLKPGGKLILDVNNRHNALAYGRLNVAWRILVDRLCFREQRGDARYQWRIGEREFAASGHLFTPAEVEGLFKAAEFIVLRRYSVDYSTGAVSNSRYRGQLFYELQRR